MASVDPTIKIFIAPGDTYDNSATNFKSRYFPQELQVGEDGEGPAKRYGALQISLYGAEEVGDSDTGTSLEVTWEDDNKNNVTNWGFTALTNPKESGGGFIMYETELYGTFCCSDPSTPC